MINMYVYVLGLDDIWFSEARSLVGKVGDTHIIDENPTQKIIYSTTARFKNLTEIRFTNALDLGKVLYNGRYKNHTGIIKNRF